MLRTVGIACVACLVWGCGPKPEAKPPETKPASPPVAQLAVEAPDLSPVKKPAEIVVVGRIARPKLFVDTLTKWSSLPVALEDLLPEKARPLSKAVLWEAPVEMLVALDTFGEGKVPPPLIIGSLGLKSLDEALSAAEAMQMPTRKIAPGIYRVGDFADVACAVSVSLGSAPARLICGHGTKDVDALLPYATRGLPSEPQTGADFELTLDAAPIQQHYGHDVTALRLLAGVAMREVALDSQRFDRALSDAIYGSVDETINLFNDLDQLRIEARLDAARNTLTAATELRLKGATSWTAGTIAALKPVPVPGTLPRLPPGTTLASYTASLPAERYAAISRILGELGEGLLEHEKLPEATRKRARRLVDAAFSKLPESFGCAVSSTATDAEAANFETTITRLSEPSARLLGMYDDFFGLVGDPAVKRWVQQKHKFDDKLWPKVKKGTLKLAGFKTNATTFDIAVDVKAWAALDPKLFKSIGSMFLTGGDNRPAHLLIAVQPDGDFTYGLMGTDAKELARVMAEQRKAEPGVYFAKTAHGDRVLAAGFVTLNYIAHSVGRSTKTADMAKALLNTPNRGATPITFSTGAGPGSVRVDVEIPAAVFGDASAAAASAGPGLKDALDKR